MRENNFVSRVLCDGVRKKEDPGNEVVGEKSARPRNACVGGCGDIYVQW